MKPPKRDPYYVDPATARIRDQDNVEPEPEPRYFHHRSGELAILPPFDITEPADRRVLPKPYTPPPRTYKPRFGPDGAPAGYAYGPRRIRFDGTGLVRIPNSPEEISILPVPQRRYPKKRTRRERRLAAARKHPNQTRLN